LVPGATLAGHGQHGCGIIEEVPDRTEGKVRLWPATLFGTLQRLMDVDLIEESRCREAPEHDDARRRYYPHTPFGRHVLAPECRRIEDPVRVIRSRGACGPGSGVLNARSPLAYQILQSQRRGQWWQLHDSAPEKILGILGATRSRQEC
jgi:hypothetical protein